MKIEAYKKLESLFNRIALISESISVLHWDAATKMPKRGAYARSGQIAELKKISHDLLVNKETEALLNEALSNTDDLSLWQKANIREMHAQWKKEKIIPKEIVVTLSHACSKCETVWREAKCNNDFSLVKPYLQEVLNLMIEIGQLKAEALNVTLYGALLNDYEPGFDCVHIDKLFTMYANFLPEFLGQVLEHQKMSPQIIAPSGPFLIDAQKELGTKIMRALGFDFSQGRLDESSHPFCGGIPEDVRVTTRYSENDFTKSLMGIIHETGHALYEMGLPENWRRQPVGQALGMSIHESQSLLFEMQVCRSYRFVKWAAPIISRAFKGSDNAWDPDNLYRLYTNVNPSLIRVDADEVTYPAHIILRYKLERAMLDRKLHVNDLSSAWNDLIRELLGIEVKSHTDGCLQDIHWYDGAWGYFPTYTLGAMTAAQFFKSACESDQNILESISNGNFEPLVSWLSTHVHNKGRLLNAPELLEKVTGEPLNPDIYINHLKTRYLDC